MATKDLIKEGRKRLGLTEQQFADAVGVSRGAVQQWERGDTAPKRDNQAAVARKLGITVAALMDIDKIEDPVGEGRFIVSSESTPEYASESESTYQTDHQTADLLAIFHRLSQAGQAEAIEYLRYLATRHGTTSPAQDRSA